MPTPKLSRMTEKIITYNRLIRLCMGYREKCLAAKGKTCIECGTDRQIVVHHVDGDRSNNDLDNLIPVCDSCHKKIHWGNGDYEEWHERLHPFSQFGDVDPERKTTITLNQVIADRLRDMKNHAESWDSFVIRMIEETARADDIEEKVIADAVVAEIEEDMGEVSNTLTQKVETDTEAVADMASDKVIEYLESMNRRR